tara:strand:+ start:2516 stop:2995 length:480 start_codon:yes stop_codon:yes gene_type:complete
MAFMEMEILGARKLEKRISKLPPKVAKKVVRTSLRAGAKIIRTRTKQITPKGKTGVLRKSIATRVAKRGRGKNKRDFALLQQFNVKKYPQLVTGKGGRRGFYPAAVEYGRAARWDAGGPKVTKPQSFIRRGFVQTKDRAEKTIISLLKSGITRVWKENK